jgi:hypothetical protein
MRTKIYLLIFVCVILSFWLYNLYYLVLEIKGLSIISLIGNLFINLYILGSIIYIIYIKFYKKAHNTVYKK